MRILLIEDNRSIIANLKYYFKGEGYEIIGAPSLTEGLDQVIQGGFDCILLDVMMPDGNGFDFYQDRLADRKIPTLFLTAKDEVDDIVTGLRMGAEDYLTKPFSPRELQARIERLVRRGKQGRILKLGKLRYDDEGMRLWLEDQEVDLTGLERKILQLLMENLNRVVTRSYFLERIWEWTGNDVNDNTLTVYINRLRKKIGPERIVTVKGIGYRIDGE